MYTMPANLKKLYLNDALFHSAMKSAYSRKIPYAEALEESILRVFNRSDIYRIRLLRYAEKYGSLPNDE